MGSGPFRSCLSVFIAVVAAGCAPSGVLQSDIQSGQPGERDTCAVCGAPVLSCPVWIAQVVFEDGTSAFFDGPRDLFEYLLSRNRYLPGKHRLEIDAIFVIDYLEQSPIDARDAFFVNGSAIHGPTGRQLVPLASLEAAESLAGQSPGARVMRFDEVTLAVLRTLSRPGDTGSTWMAGGSGPAR